MARIGIWGGSFNPPTLAHLAMADYAFDILQLDELWWIVSPHNPLKDGQVLAPFHHRLAMVKILLEERPAMHPSDLEEELGSSLTLNTLRYIRQHHPDDDVFFMMGADNWRDLHLWGEDAPLLFDHASLVVLRRPGYDGWENASATKEFRGRQVSHAGQLKKSGTWIVVENDLIDASATEVRIALAKGETPTHMDPRILRYIAENNLYKASAGE